MKLVSCNYIVSNMKQHSITSTRLFTRLRGSISAIGNERKFYGGNGAENRPHGYEEKEREEKHWDLGKKRRP